MVDTRHDAQNLDALSHINAPFRASCFQARDTIDERDDEQAVGVRVSTIECGTCNDGLR